MRNKIDGPRIPPIPSYTHENLAEVCYEDALKRGPRIPDNEFWERFAFERSWRIELLERVRIEAVRGTPCRKS